MKRIQLVWLVVVVCIIDAAADTPRWVHDTPVPSNDTYEFIVVESVGRSINEARQNAKTNLASDEQLKSGVLVREKSSAHTIVQHHDNGDDFVETVDESFIVNLTFDGKEFPLKARKIDEYYRLKNDEYQMYTLYQVAVTDHPVFDRAYISSTYGAAPVLMSVIPGLGQWYKGSKAKAVGFLASELVAVAGIIWTENERATNVKLGKQNPEYLNQYSGRANNWETGRNVCLGLAAGIWICNIIDAACAKGAHRLIVSPNNGKALSITPYFSPDATGVSFAYTF